MKVLVTGGAGFIGSHVVEAYLAAGYDVVVVDNLRSGREENVDPRARFYRLDVTSPELATVFDHERPDIVNHHAAQTSVTFSVRDATEDARINILGMIRVADLAVSSQVQKLLFASTGGALYGEPRRLPAQETDPIEPLSPYGASKYACEIYLGLYGRLRGLRCTILRYANVYGPRQDPHGEAGVVAIFAQAMIAGGRPTIFGDGSQTRDFVFVSDVARANLLASASSAEGTTHVSTEIETSVNDLYRILREKTGCAEEPHYAPARPGDVQRITLDAARARELWRWRPEVSLEEGLRRTVAWVQESAGTVA